MTTALLSRLDREKNRLCTIFLATLVWGLAAHGYALLNFTVSHDSMNEFWIYQQISYYSGTAAQWKIALGRFLSPVYQLLFRGETVTPWFGGMLALLWIALAVWGTACLFGIRERWLLIFTSGIFTVNLSVTALTASYLHDLDADMFAVLAAVCAVLLWKQGGWRQLFAIPMLVITLGIYQSMLSVYISFVIFLCILHLAQNSNAKSVFLDGLRAIGIMASAGIMYLLLSKAACALCGLTLTQQENGLVNMLDGSMGLFGLLLGTFTSWLSLFATDPPRINSVFNLLLFFSALMLVVDILRSKDIPIPNKLLILLLGLLLPFGANVSAFLNNGEVHLLMLYAAWFLYLLILLLCRRVSQKKPKTLLLCGLLVFLILFSNIRFANELYTRKDQERQATLSLMTRVCTRMEQTEGYIPGETEVAILGTPVVQQQPGYSQTYEITGALFPTPITTEDFYGAYFSNILQTPIRLCDAQRREELAAEAEALPAFPDQNCIAWIDGTLVLKLSRTIDRKWK